MSTITSKNELITLMSEGYQPKFRLFWGHQKEKDGSVGKGCLSQWFESCFEIDDIRYLTAEHYMMARKAKLFNDFDILEKILKVTHPKEAKSLGRKVKGYDEKIWRQHRFDIVVEANFEKFSQHNDLLTFLQNTQQRVLVEASPYDKIWGVGMGANHPDIENPGNWKGLNLLGFALMKVRSMLVKG